MELTAERLRSLLNYNPDTGIFVRLVGVRGFAAGTIAGSVPASNGYLLIGVDRRRYTAHRLAWFYVYGFWPPHDLDHVDGDKTNNRIANLRLAERWQNNANSGIPRHNTSGAKGVCWSKQHKKWKAEIRINCSRKHIGLFDSVEEASRAYQAASVAARGQFARR